MCIDFEVAIRRLASVFGVDIPLLTGVSPSMTILCRLWQDIRLASEFKPILQEQVKRKREPVRISFIYVGQEERATHIDLRSSNGRLGTRLGLLATLAKVFVADSEMEARGESSGKGIPAD